MVNSNTVTAQRRDSARVSQGCAQGHVCCRVVHSIRSETDTTVLSNVQMIQRQPLLAPSSARATNGTSGSSRLSNNSYYITFMGANFRG